MYTNFSREGGFKPLIPLRKSRAKNRFGDWWNLYPEPGVAIIMAVSPAGITGAVINDSIDVSILSGRK